MSEETSQSTMHRQIDEAFNQAAPLLLYSAGARKPTPACSTSCPKVTPSAPKALPHGPKTTTDSVLLRAFTSPGPRVPHTIYQIPPWRCRCNSSRIPYACCKRQVGTMQLGKGDVGVAEVALRIGGVPGCGRRNRDLRVTIG